MASTNFVDNTTVILASWLNEVDGVVWDLFGAVTTPSEARQKLGENASGSFFTRKHNFSGTAAPTANDDTTQGYVIGSWWYDTTNDKVYTCLDATASSAVWKDLSFIVTLPLSIANGGTAASDAATALSNLGGIPTTEKGAANGVATLDATTKIPVAQLPAFRGALVKQSSAQSISNATFTALAFDTEEYDTDSIHDNVTNNSRLTVPSGVTKVRLAAYIAFASNSTGLRLLSIGKNGSTVFIGGASNGVSAATDSIGRISVCSSVVSVVGGDYFEAKVWQASGSALNTDITYASFSMEIIE